MKPPVSSIKINMGKKSQQKSIIISDPQKMSKTTPRRSVKEPLKKLWIRIILVVAVLIMYGNSISYDFTIDDNIFYVHHSSVQKGLSGIDEMFKYGSLEKYNGMTGVQPYRPITLVSFAIQKQLFDNDPGKAHLVNIFLYCLLVLVLFNLLLKLLPGANPLICGIITLVFAVHPIHTEVVASVKSQDELLSGLFVLLALSYAVSLIKEDKYSWKFGILSVLFYTLALFSKEGAFAMILIFPLAFWLLLSQSIKRSLLYSLPYLGVAALFLLARNAVLSGQVQNYHNTVLENVLFNAKGLGQMTATKMEILFHYLRLGLVPWPLSWDYSYNQVPLVDWSSFTPWISVILYLAMFSFAVLKIKKLPVISFGIFFYLIMLAPTANLLFLNGSTLSERFLFLPSLGLILALVYGLGMLLKSNLDEYPVVKMNKLNPILGVIIAIFIILTIIRSNDWHNNLSIYRSGVENAPKSSRTNSALGNEYRKQAEKEADPMQRNIYLTDAIKYSKISLDILPSNRDALYNLGVTYGEMGDSTNAIAAYKNTLWYYPDHRSALNNLGTFYVGKNQFDSAYAYLKRCFDVDSTVPKSSQNLAIYYFKVGKYDQAIQFASNAIRLDKYTLISYDIMSQAYKALGNVNEAARYKALYGQMAADAPEAPKNGEN